MHLATAKNRRQKWLTAANKCQNGPRYSQDNKQNFFATANAVKRKAVKISSKIRYKWTKNTLKRAFFTSWTTWGLVGVLGHGVWWRLSWGLKF